MSEKFKPTYFTMPRDRTISGTKGHTIHFEKNKPTHVPRSMWAEVQAAGAVPADELPEEVKPVSRRPESQAEVEEVVFAAFEQIVLGNQREDFAATGVPHAKALERILGFKMDNKERDALWQAYKTKED